MNIFLWNIYQTKIPLEKKIILSLSHLRWLSWWVSMAALLNLVSLGKLSENNQRFLGKSFKTWTVLDWKVNLKGKKKKSPFSFIRRQVVSIWVILVSLAGYRLFVYFFSVRKANCLNDILKLTLSRRKKKRKFLWPLSLPKSIFFVNLGKEIRNIWVQWKGNYQFQKRNKLKTLLRRTYFQAKTLEL